MTMSYSIGNTDKKLHRTSKCHADIDKLSVTIFRSQFLESNFTDVKEENILYFTGLLATSPFGFCALLLVLDPTTSRVILFFL